MAANIDESGKVSDHDEIHIAEGKESHLRSVLKGFTWRIIATTTTITIAYVITGEAEMAFSIGAIEFIGKIFIYYLHERVWQAVPKGGVRKLFGFLK